MKVVIQDGGQELKLEVGVDDLSRAILQALRLQGKAEIKLLKHHETTTGDDKTQTTCYLQASFAGSSFWGVARCRSRPQAQLQATISIINQIRFTNFKNSPGRISLQKKKQVAEL